MFGKKNKPDIKRLEERISNLERLVYEIQNPPKFKAGDIIDYAKDCNDKEMGCLVVSEVYPPKRTLMIRRTLFTV